MTVRNGKSIMAADVKNYLQDNLKAFCREQGLEMPKTWAFPPHGTHIYYAVSLHLNGKDRWEEFDAKIVFVLSKIGNLNALENQLHCILEDLGEPTILTVKAVETPCQYHFSTQIGMMRMPVTWADDSQNVYEVYAKGQIEMGGFVNLMERLEYIGKEVIFKNYGKTF